ncbi:transglycosylase family protein [Streptococcus zalophi]|uniref:Transglycosylase family protein n=1 Tax=Streptococcus zalophi TaxID=640031 RepID=A0A934UDR7_9STRE|nr:transglycosylase family protein [Streptococcus zalophi]MBJ8350086.1 transglycosylase family protein [Streptococcus zalophi]MCR8968138.1 transglycosylase family protein [Streptococcus zalophi]
MLKRRRKLLQLVMLAIVVSLTAIFTSRPVNTDSYSVKTEVKKEKLLSVSDFEKKKLKQTLTSKANIKKAIKTTTKTVETTEETTTQESTVEETQLVTEPSTTIVEEPVVTQPVQQTAPSAYPVVLPNGNTAGEIGSQAAAQMAAATGVPQETWEYIIARESNGNPSAANPSGASGLFQTMPGWGSTATVDQQIETAIKVYNTQGLSAWGMQ